MTLPTISSSDEADSILSSHSICTSEDLIKTLKSNHSNSIDSNVKLRIANASFHSSSLQLTNKSTVLIDWLITEINKAKRELDKSNPQKPNIPSDQLAFHFNPNTYHLLSILQSENDSNIYKFPSLSILDSISRNPDLQVDFLQGFSISLEPLLRNSSVRSSTTSNGFDSLQESIGNLVNVLPSWLALDGEGEGEERERNLISGARILNAIILPWIGALENGGNQKKATKHFLHDSTNFKSLLLAFHSIDSIRLSSSTATSTSSSSSSSPSSSNVSQTSLASKAKKTLLSSLENILQFSSFSTDQLLKFSSNWESFYQDQVLVASDKGKGKQKEEGIEGSSNVLEILSKMLDSTSDDASKSKLRSSILKILPVLLKVGLTRLSSESFSLFSRINPPINSTGIQPTFRSKQEISEIYRRVSFKSLILPSFQFLVSTREKDDFDSAKIRFRSIIFLLEKISNDGLYIPSACLEEEYGTWLASLKHVFDFCLWVYENDWGKSEREDLEMEVLEGFDLLYKIEEKVVDENKLKRAFKMMNTNHPVPSTSMSISNPDTSFNKAQEFLKTLISSHSNSRNLFQLIKVFLNSLMDSLHFPEKGSISSIQIINSPLLSFEIKRFLQTNVRNYLTVNQVEEVLKMFHQDSRFILKDIEGSEGENLNGINGKKRSSSSDINEKFNPSKKRKSNSGIANGISSGESSQCQTAISELIILLEFFSYILPSLPISNFNLKENRKEIVSFNREILDVVLRKGLEETGPRIGFRRLISGVLKVKTSIGQQQWFDEFQNHQDQDQDQDVEMKEVENEKGQVEEGNDDWIVKSLDLSFSSILKLLLQEDGQDSESQIWKSELKIEFLRSFFNRLSIANETFDQEGVELLSGILHSDSNEISNETLIETSLSTDDEKETGAFEWNGKVHGLNKENEGLVVWKSLVQDSKTLSLLNQYASDSLILFLSKFLFKTLAVKGSREDNSRNQILHQLSTRLVKDFSFMELKRWRDILVQRLVLEDTKELNNQSNKLNSKTIEKTLTSMLSLSQFRNEIMTSKQKVTILTRLLKLDALLSEEEIVDADLLKSKVKLRTFACSLLSDLNEADLKAFGFTFKSDQISSFVPKHIYIIQELQVENDSNKLEKKLNSITLILFEIFCQKLVQSVKKNQSEDDNWVVVEKLIDALNSPREEGSKRKSKGKGKESTSSTSRSLADEALVKLVEILLEIDATEHNSTSSLPVNIIKSLQTSRLSITAEKLKENLNKLNQQGLELVSNSGESKKSLEDQLNGFIRQLTEVRLSLKIKDLKLKSSESMDVDDSNQDSSMESSEILKLTTKFLETSCQAFLSFKAESNHRSSLNGSALRLSREILRLLNVCGGLTKGRVVEEKDNQVQVLDEKNSEKSLGISSSLGLAACLSVLDSSDAIRYLSPTFTNVSTQLSISDYQSTLEALLSIIVASTSGSHSDPSSARDRNAVLKVYELLLRWGPEGTSKFSRTSFSNFLGYSSQLASKTTDPLPLLQVVDGVCAGKAMLLTAFDASRILSILSVVVGPSDISLTTSMSNSSSVSSTFSLMVSTLSSLTRLRRDLISPLLPQLTSVLSQLISLFRTPRANLPKVQLIETIKAYPAWMIKSTGEISSLNEESAREFSRLLNGLITKTTLSLSLDSLSSSKKRKQDSSSSSRNANNSSSSLSKSLSKHSSNILLSYILSLTSSTTTIPTNVRTELLPGLFALFETIGEFERDSLMVSGLYGNEGGKVILRRVWKEWERTRYKGQ